MLNFRPLYYRQSHHRGYVQWDSSIQSLDSYFLKYLKGTQAEFEVRDPLYPVKKEGHDFKTTRRAKHFHVFNFSHFVLTLFIFYGIICHLSVDSSPETPDDPFRDVF